MRFDLEGGDAARGQIGIERFGQLEIDGAVGGKIELLRALEREAAVRVQIGVFAGDVERIEMDAAAGQRGVRAAVTLELNAGDGDGQLLELRVAAKLLGMRERPVDRDRSGQRGFAAERVKVRHAKQCADVELGKVELSVRCVVVAECSLARAG